MATPSRTPVEARGRCRNPCDLLGYAVAACHTVRHLLARRHAMTVPDGAVPRRTMLKGAGLSLAAGLLSEIEAVAAESEPAAAPIWSADYWARKGSVPLYLFRKRMGAPNLRE